MVCMQCGFEPCECQRALVVPSDWINQTCSTAGCTVVIRCKIGKQAATLPVCKWCQAGAAYYRNVSSPVRLGTGPMVTLDEFGRDLYDAIVLKATAAMAANGVGRLRKAGLAKEADQAEKSAHMAELALGRLLDKGTLSPADVRRILTIQ